MIYDHAMHFEPELPLGQIPVDDFDPLGAMIQLSGISRQIRREVHARITDQVIVIALTRTMSHRLMPLP
jgi:hypothetical protein